MYIFVISAKAEEYKTLGNEMFSKKEYAGARDMYTEGIKLNCQNKELNAKLYNNRATQHFYLGKRFLLREFTVLGVVPLQEPIRWAPDRCHYTKLFSISLKQLFDVFFFSTF